MTIQACLAVLLISGVAATVTAGEITGKVKLKGSPKPEIPIVFDPTCKKMHAQQVTTRHYVVGQDNGLGNVFVYIKEGAKKTPPPDKPAVLDQQNCLYQPYIFGAVTGQKIIVKNSDPLLHNVHGTPKVNKEFNFAQPVKGQENTVSFDKPEVLVRIKCDVHPWMFSYVGVVDHPYFAVTDKDGNFTIPNVPPGKYVLEAYHLKAGSGTQDVTLAQEDKKTVQFELAAPTQ